MWRRVVLVGSGIIMDFHGRVVEQTLHLISLLVLYSECAKRHMSAHLFCLRVCLHQHSLVVEWCLHISSTYYELPLGTTAVWDHLFLICSSLWDLEQRAVWVYVCLCLQIRLMIKLQSGTLASFKFLFDILRKSWRRWNNLRNLTGK